MKKYVKILIMMVPFAFLLPITIIHFLFKIPAPYPFFVSEWTAGDIISYMVTFMTFLGTLFLGILSLYQNKKLSRINNDLVQHQYKPIISVETLMELDAKEELRTYDRRVRKDYETNYLINMGWTLHQRNFLPHKIISIINIGMGPAVDVELYWYKLDSVDGLSNLKQIKEETIEDFYDRVNYSSFHFIDSNEYRNEPWLIYRNFNLGIEKETNRLNLLFSFEENIKDLHSIIEIRYENISGVKMKKLLYLAYESLYREMQVMPVSKEFLQGNKFYNELVI